jgi:asparagine synthase (glutamine-hydrolysing)
MCGIAGLFKFNQSVTPDDIQAVRLMMDAQTHRGPDDSGLFQNENVVLGHRRLSIIDLSESGRQPMSNEACPECGCRNRKIWVTYNGEIYNYQELRKELGIKGHTFRSQTDTEVLVHGYEEWGIEKLINRLRGMFAFVLYETSLSHPGVSKIILARDRFGIKPLYYAKNGDQVLFASEVRALAASRLLRMEEDPRAWVSFLLTGSVPAPWTTLQSVLALPAGYYLMFTLGQRSLVHYYDFMTGDGSTSNSSNTENPYATVRGVLQEATRLHLISDAPLGVFLSGGIDSSALTALAATNRTHSLTTLSIIFEEPAYSEAPYQRAVAARYRTDHHEILVKEEDFWSAMPSIFHGMDQPSIDGVNTYIISRAAKDTGIKTLLSGLGGDEVFWGYPSFQKIRWLRMIQSLPDILKGPLRLSDFLPGSWRRLGYLASDDPLSLYLTIRGLFTPKETADVLGCDEGQVLEVLRELNPTWCNPTPEVFLQRMEFNWYLQNQLLKDTDGMSMAHSVEIRVPFLDHYLVETVGRLDKCWKQDRKTPKPLLVRSLDGLLPQEVVFRSKQGFTFPFAQWLKREKLRILIGEGRTKEHYWRLFEKGQVHWSKPWALAVQQQFKNITT